MTWDLIIMGVACFIVVIVESRRLGMKYRPVIYLVLGNLIAVACIFPLFLSSRERRQLTLQAESA